MTRFAIGMGDGRGERACALCGAVVAAPGGPRLMLVDGQAPVCASCGRTHAAELTALLHVAQVAAQVGRINHHNRSWPMLDALLKLAQASESYYLSLTRRESAA